MLVGVALEVLPELVVERVFPIHNCVRAKRIRCLRLLGPIFGMQNAVLAPSAFGGQLQSIPAERNFVAQAHAHSPLTVSWAKLLRADHPVQDLFKFVSARSLYR